MTDVIIIGGGLAGLTAANYLHRAGLSFQILEATERVGGRMKTDRQDGFLLDRGFQVLLTAYPEARRLLDYEKLDLRTFDPGAVLLMPGGKIARIGDPLRDISSLFPTLFSPVGSLQDKLRILSLRNRLKAMTVEAIFQQPEKSTLEVLKSDYQFGDEMIEGFFRPFFSGIFLESDLVTSRRMFDFVFKMFSEGQAAVPNKGMEEIPLQLAGNLPPGCIRTKCVVTKIEGKQVATASGETFQGKCILLATEATGLVSYYAPQTNNRFVSTRHLHFSVTKPPFMQPLIALNACQNKEFHNLCTISQVAPGYTPDGKHLVSVSISDDPAKPADLLIQKVRQQLSQWFGKETDQWNLLSNRLVRYALPDQSKVNGLLTDNQIRLGNELYRCGDHLLNGSIQAAMMSGRRASELIEKDLKKR